MARSSRVRKARPIGGLKTPSPTSSASRGAEGARGADLTRRHRVLAAIVVKAAAGFPAQPPRFHILHQQRAGAVLRIRETLVKHLHHAETGVETDEVGELQG